MAIWQQICQQQAATHRSLQLQTQSVWHAFTWSTMPMSITNDVVTPLTIPTTWEATEDESTSMSTSNHVGPLKSSMVLLS